MTLIEGAFLFTDIEDSTRLWDEHTDAMTEALRRHDEILEDVVSSHRGRRVKHTGDGMLAEFGDPADAAAAAIEAQQRLRAEPWIGLPAIRVRMGIHHGRAERRAGDLFGPHVNRAARLMDAAPGGGVYVSELTAGALWQRLPRETELVDLGPHRLRSTTPIERVFAIRHPTIADVDLTFRATEPVAAAAEAPPISSNLGIRLASFVGRDRERTALSGMLEASRLVTVTGPGGVGKTSLAAETARGLTRRFPDGLVAVKLGSASVQDDVSVHVVDALGLPVEAFDGRDRPRTTGDAVIDHISNRRMLVLLDNCEHVLASARWYVPRWLRVCPNLVVLVTSRQPMRLQGELVMPLGPLSLPAGTSPTAVLESGAGRLLVDRLTEARPTLLLTDRTSPVVAELCHRLDGLPLALELVGARAVALPIEEILRRIDEDLDLLAQPATRGGRRQQTLASTVAWSWDLLTEAERSALARLTIFPSTFDLSAAEAVVGRDLEEPALELLTSLIEQSLVHGLDDRIGRFRLLSPIHEFAARRLPDLDREACHDRHAEYMTGIATAGVASSWTVGITRSSQHLLDLRSDLHLAFGHAMNRGQPGWALAIASALGLLDLRTGTVPDAAQRIDDALGLDGAPVRRRAVALMVKAAVALSRREDADGGLAAARAARSMAADDSADIRAEAEALVGIGLNLLGRRQEAVDWLERSRRTFVASGHQWAIAFSAAALGEALQATAPDDARSLFTEAIDQFDGAGDVWGMAWAAAGLARLLKLDESLAALEHLLARVASSCDDPHPDSFVALLAQTVMALSLAGQTADARRLAEEAAEIAGRRSVPYSTALGDLAVGVVGRHDGDIGEAMQHLERGHRILDELASRSASHVTGIEIARLEIDYHLGRVLEATDPAPALRLQIAGLRRSLRWAEPWSVARAMLGITSALLASGHPDRAGLAMAYTRQEVADRRVRLGPGFRQREWDPVADCFPEIPSLLGSTDQPSAAVLGLAEADPARP